MQRTPLIAALICALLAVPARGATRLVIRGGGFGHGVGMSQYGAYGYAERGKDYRFILAHYYTGTRLSRLSSEPTVRVLLDTGATSFSGASRAGGRRLSPGSTYRAEPSGVDRVALLTAGGRRLRTFPTPLRITGPGPLGVGAGGRYRGALELKNTPLGFLVVNAVGLEDYVRGVVGAESPPSWPADALKAQAVAARTYAITTGGGPNFDQYPDTRSQVYRGLAAETPTTDAAVAATSDQVVTYAGKPAVTYFFSTSGGRTENVENSFIGADPKPWLRSVSDPYDDESPRHRWGPYRYTMAQAAARLSGLVKGRFRGIDVVQRGRSPRVVYADVVGTRGRTRVTGPQLRARFDLLDTWATFKVITASGTTQGPPSGESSPPSDGQTGGVSAGGARAASVSRTLSGRVGWVERPTLVKLQRRSGGRWRTLYEVATDRRGRYAIGDLDRGAYRVRWRGDASEPVVL